LSAQVERAACSADGSRLPDMTCGWFIGGAKWLVAEETAAVARTLGVSLPYADSAQRVRQHCRDIGTSKPSMLQDMERGRPTEVDAINGAIVCEGARPGVPTPSNQALLMLIKARQEVSARQDASAGQEVSARPA